MTKTLGKIKCWKETIGEKMCSFICIWQKKIHCLNIIISVYIMHVLRISASCKMLFTSIYPCCQQLTLKMCRILAHRYSHFLLLVDINTEVSVQQIDLRGYVLLMHVVCALHTVATEHPVKIFFYASYQTVQ